MAVVEETQAELRQKANAMEYPPWPARTHGAPTEGRAASDGPRG
jgi:hypothetical protein